MDALSSFSILFLLTIFQLSYAQDDFRFTSCTPFDCGKIVDISYPFWTDQHNRPSYCGFPNEGYTLKCRQNQPLVMTLNSQEFYVFHLNWSHGLLTIKRTIAKSAGIQVEDMDPTKMKPHYLPTIVVIILIQLNATEEPHRLTPSTRPNVTPFNPKLSPEQGYEALQNISVNFDPNLGRESAKPDSFDTNNCNIP
ncbi:hypothetical protein Goari_025278 [Gossypium aridum]|uniref:Wall-associated receptor kinase galacturonan-binding domain-containing protein n=1 Tax=Gossypium aridum TaxID=34290 RepID=A0A7J8XA28_GOSAI|nr:hypothetical protein [Gossypium aridum]